MGPRKERVDRVHTHPDTVGFALGLVTNVSAMHKDSG